MRAVRTRQAENIGSQSDHHFTRQVIGTWMVSTVCPHWLHGPWLARPCHEQAAHRGRPDTRILRLAVKQSAPEVLFELADASLYRAKAEGRDRVVHATA